MELFLMSVTGVDDLNGLRRAFGGWLERCGAHRQDAFGLRLAVHEAALLALKSETPVDLVEVRAVADGEEIVTEVDGGPAGAWDVEPEAGQGSEVDAASLIRSLVERVELTARPQRCTMRLRVPRGDLQGAARSG